jgi:hypothetical protein
VPASYEVTIGALDALTGLGINVILLCRMFAVFPPSRTSRRMLVAVFVVPIILKLYRVATLAVYIVMDMRDFRLHPNTISQPHDSNKNVVRLFDSRLFIAGFDNLYVDVATG